MKNIFMIFMTLFMIGCNNNDVEINKLSEKKIRKIIDTELPAGSSIQQVETFLKKHKIEYTYHEGERDLGVMIRTPMEGGIYTLFFSHVDYLVTFYFDDKNELVRYEWKHSYIGL